MAIQSPLPPGGIDVIVVNTIFTFLAIVAVIARFCARYIQRRPISIDDYLIVAGLVGASLATAEDARSTLTSLTRRSLRSSQLRRSAWAMHVCRLILFQLQLLMSV